MKYLINGIKFKNNENAGEREQHNWAKRFDPSVYTVMTLLCAGNV